MNFFANITALQVFALVLLAAGAVICFASKSIASRFRYKHADLVWKFVGLAVAIVGFILVFTVL